MTKKQVSETEFFAALNADARDIMPSIIGKYPYVSKWMTKTGGVFGESAAGKYFLFERSSKAEEVNNE